MKTKILAFIVLLMCVFALTSCSAILSKDDADDTVFDPNETLKDEEHIHAWGEWVAYAGNNGVFCENVPFYRICTSCNTIEWKNGAYENHTFKIVTTPPTCTAQGYDTKTCTICGLIEVGNYTGIAHSFATTYSHDSSFHWYECTNCEATSGYGEHTNGKDGFCTVCDQPLAPTEGILYEVSADGTYAEVVGYAGTATRIMIADTYQGLPVKTILKEVFILQMRL